MLNSIGAYIGRSIGWIGYCFGMSIAWVYNRNMRERADEEYDELKEIEYE